MSANLVGIQASIPAGQSMSAIRQPLALLLIFLGSFVSSAVAEDNTTALIQREIARVRESLKAHPVADKDFATVSSMTDDALKAATEALKAGHVYLSLMQLDQAEGLLGGAGRLSQKDSVGKGGLPAFESEWGKISLRLTALERDAHARNWQDAPLVIRALAEEAQGKAIPLLEGGRGFATANGPTDGLFYMGQAEGEADFAGFCASLKPGGKPSFPLRSLAPELQALQQRVNAAFQPPKSIDLHPRFISLNSTLKLAEELDASRFYAGALLSYLEAVRHYGMLDAHAVDASGQDQVRRDLAAAQMRLASSAADDESVPELLLERAGSFVEHADGSAPSADEWRGARVILDQVLPAYYAAKKPAAALPSVAGKTVNITLVRWPYT